MAASAAMSTLAPKPAHVPETLAYVFDREGVPMKRGERVTLFYSDGQSATAAVR